MLPLVAIEAVEEKPVRARDVPDGGHCSTKGYYSPKAGTVTLKKYRQMNPPI